MRRQDALRSAGGFGRRRAFGWRLLARSAALLAIGTAAFGSPLRAADSSDAVCRTIAARYQSIRDAEKRAPAKPFAYPDSPLGTLASDPQSGVRVAGNAVDFHGYSREKLVAWAKSAAPPIVVSADLLDAVDRVTSEGSSFVMQLPGEPYYAVGSIAGTLECYALAYFTVSDGRAHAAAGPPSWDDENGAGCAVARSMAAVDGVPVAFEEAFDEGPQLSSTVTAATWSEGRFLKACTVAFTFSARFAPRGTFNRWDEACSGDACEAMRGKAQAMVEAVQNGPQAAQQAAIGALTPPQQAAYDAILAVSPPLGGDDTDPATLRDDQPLRLPAVVNGQVYLAELGHETIGWRVYSDWSVTFLSQQDSDTKQIARFAIGMTKGALVGVTVR